ncbi:hypothetical protein D187_009678 [Cystobacter fuscus DSM 2262]|uniref:Uncharacterized protein n=1 Tax=Cystobacter fuscus (strain ATCC 25194 / DSM 2262 / NBRC 100088 / M29) TaxID=1242864 RepID=S9Q105_CYSF2|nr:hypothetical protein [Cystobacter fuscus]EPX54939.1 hypothetical protein D187_009678 [Cystobacter fuscus DSM 2262]
MSVGKALKQESALVAAVHPGKRALRKGDRERVVESAAVRVIDSLDLDAQTSAERGNENRWDYLLGTTQSNLPLIAVEVHPANTGEVKVLIAKKRAAEKVLRSELKPGATVKRWYWIASGKTVITRNTPESRMLDAAGIRLVGSHLHLERDS